MKLVKIKLMQRLSITPHKVNHRKRTFPRILWCISNRYASIKYIVVQDNKKLAIRNKNSYDGSTEAWDIRGVYQKPNDEGCNNTSTDRDF